MVEKGAYRTSNRNSGEKRYNKVRMIFDPIHGFIELTKTEDRLIGILAFQRLRYIKQLGTVYFVFPTATHTRFSHSLGAMYLASILATRFEELGFIEDDYEIKLARISALLHDIGHTPFSHVLEDILLKRGKNLSHEDLAVKIIMNTEIGDILREEGINPKDVAFIIKKKYRNPVLNYIISSPIDADRMDYLQRDAYYTGVNYGNVSVERIIKLVKLPRQHDIEGIIFPAKASDAIDNFFIGRYQMYKTVYTHRVVNAYASLLEVIYHGLCKEGYLPETSEVLEMLNDGESWFFFNDSLILMKMKEYLKKGKKGCLKDFIRAFIMRKKIKTVREIRMDDKDFSEIKKEVMNSLPKLDDDFVCPSKFYHIDKITLIGGGMEVFLEKDGRLISILDKKSGTLISSILAHRKRKEEIIRIYSF